MAKTVDPNPFGRPIKKADAQRMYKNFYKIKKRSLDKFRQPFADDCESMRYHGGLYKKTDSAETSPQFKCSFLDMAFVFDAGTLLDMLQPKGKPHPGGIIIFQGSRDKEDSVVDVLDKDGNPIAQKYGDVDGRPTLLVFPFSYQEGAKARLQDKASANIVVALDDGLEHPGTGGGGGDGVGDDEADTELGSSVSDQPADVTLPIPGTIPATYSVANIHHLIVADL